MPPLPTTAATKKAQIVPFTPPPASPQSSGDTEKPKGFSKSVPSPFPRSRELPFAVFLGSLCTISSLPAAPLELEISSGSGEAQSRSEGARHPGERRTPGSTAPTAAVASLRAPVHLRGRSCSPALRHGVEQA